MYDAVELAAIEDRPVLYLELILVSGLNKEFDEQVLWPKTLRMMGLARKVSERMRLKSGAGAVEERQ